MIPAGERDPRLDLLDSSMAAFPPQPLDYGRLAIQRPRRGGLIPWFWLQAASRLLAMLGGVVILWMIDESRDLFDLVLAFYPILAIEAALIWLHWLSRAAPRALAPSDRP